MRVLARLGTASLVLTYLHLVFGGIVRITGSGMGCGDHWPKCNGSWIPPFDNPTVMIEWTHRLLALLVMVSIAWLAFAARTRRNQPGVGGKGGVLRPAGGALVLVVAVALLGLVTVKLGNTTLATVAHWTLALTLLAVLIVAAVRAGALGGAAARLEGGTSRAVRSLSAGAALAYFAVVLGGLVAKFPGAAVACPSFPLCGTSPAGVPAGASHIQLTHRVLGYLLFVHVIAVASAVSRRSGESRVTARTAKVAAALVLSQLVIGAAMVLSVLPPALRSAHQAVGIGVWLTMFLAAYLARTAEMGKRKSEMGA
ncbi:MAG: COX15/CtaA family protein [Gemmatimonadaceae bacterium]